MTSTTSYSERFAFVTQLLNQLCVRNINEVLIIPTTHLSRLLPILIAADEYPTYVLLSTVNRQFLGLSCGWHRLFASDA